MQSTEKLDIKSFLFIFYVIYLENYGVTLQLFRVINSTSNS